VSVSSRVSLAQPGHDGTLVTGGSVLGGSVLRSPLRLQAVDHAARNANRAAREPRVPTDSRFVVPSPACGLLPVAEAPRSGPGHMAQPEQVANSKSEIEDPYDTDWRAYRGHARSSVIARRDVLLPALTAIMTRHPAMATSEIGRRRSSPAVEVSRVVTLPRAVDEGRPSLRGVVRCCY